ncbi:MAG: hypothetical protein K2Q21_11465 [Chitinophagaceae bacterium]|nr:hypothetical protein [Chitinophagaceae bacterium]
MQTGNSDTTINRMNTILLVFVLFCTCTLPANGQSGFPFVSGDQVIYYPKLAGKTQSLESIKLGLQQSLKKVVQIYDFTERKTFNAKDIKNITVLDNRIEIDVKGQRNNLNWLFSNIEDSTMFFFGKQNAGNYVFLPSVANLAFNELDAAQQFADNIYAIQYPNINKVRDSLLQVFKERIKLFKATNKEAEVSDAQRLLLLASDSASRNLDYFESIRICNRAIQINEMAYPRAYANLALLYAHINFFDYAILCMQKYLLLQPEPTDARGALDKLYEWEGLIYY